MFKKLSILAIVVVMAFGVALAANSKAFALNAASAKTTSTIVWNGEPDKAVAKNIDAVQNNTRKNASGAKITSNAHSDDFPGIYFIWDSKQKDNGYLKVESWVFDKYESFVLTSKESSTYWDFTIALQDGQSMTSDGCYVFYIPKVYNNKNINMVFVSEFTNNEVVSHYVPMVSTTDTGYFQACDDYMTEWKNYETNNNIVFFGNFSVGVTSLDDENLVAGEMIWDKDAVTIASFPQGENTSVTTFRYAEGANLSNISFNNFKIAADNEFVLLVNGVPVLMSDGFSYVNDTYGKNIMDYVVNGSFDFGTALAAEISNYNHTTPRGDTPFSWNEVYTADSAAMKAAVGNANYVEITVYGYNSYSDAALNPAGIIFAGSFNY